MKAIAAILTLLVPSFLAAQTITGSDGLMDHGEAYTISGSGFGSKTNASPLYYDTISNQSGYSGHDTSNGAEVPVIADGDCPTCPWPDRGNSGSAPAFYDGALNRFSGQKAYYAPKKAWFAEKVFSTVSESDKIYMSWWVYSKYPLYVHSGGVTFNKLVRWVGTSNWEDQIEIESNGVYGSDNACASAGWAWFNQYPQMPGGQWWHIEALLDGGGNYSAGSASFEIYFDGVLKSSDSSLYSCSGPLNRLSRWGSDPSNYDYPNDQTILFGELYFDNSWARVTLGNASTFAASTHREVQPTTSWSASEIGFTVNTGSFESGDSGWLYVSDSSGNVGAGFPVVIGASGGGLEPVALTAPTNLQVNGGN